MPRTPTARSTTGLTGVARGWFSNMSRWPGPFTRRERNCPERVRSYVSRHRQGFCLLAGRYEGIDERLIENEVDEELSLGDFVLSGGEIAAMAVIDAVTRLLPGVLGDDESASQDSFMDGLLDHPHYIHAAGDYRWSACASGAVVG